MAAGSSGMKSLKVWSHDRLVRKGVIVQDFNQLKLKCREKFQIDESESINFVLESDGTEIDKEYFDSLEPKETIIVLRSNECWSAKGNSQNPQSKAENNGSSLEEVVRLVERVKKRKHAGDDKTIATVKVIIGWLHWSFKDDKYKQIRSCKGQLGGTVECCFLRSTSYDEVLERALRQFFPKGRSKKGTSANMSVCLGNVKGIEIPRSANFNLGDYLQACPTQKTRIYLLTKPKSITVDDLITSSSDELPDVSLSHQSAASNLSVQETENVLNTLDGQTPSRSTAQPLFINAGTPTIQMRAPGHHCPVCMDREKDAVLFPCGHPICTPCGTHLQLNLETCPLCRSVINRVCSVTSN